MLTEFNRKELPYTNIIHWINIRFFQSFFYYKIYKTNNILLFTLSKFHVPLVYNRLTLSFIQSFLHRGNYFIQLQSYSSTKPIKNFISNIPLNMINWFLIFRCYSQLPPCTIRVLDYAKFFSNR